MLLADDYQVIKLMQRTCAGNVKGADALLDLVHGLVLISVGEVGHHLERHDLDAQLVPVLLDFVLSIIRTVEVNALGVLSGAGVVTTDNEMCGTVILANDGVPDSFTRTTHAHSQRQKTEHSHAVWISRKKSLVDTDTGKVIDVARLGQTNDGVDEHVGLTGTGSANGQLTMGAVHWVAGLEGDDLGPAKLVKV